jgi:hypothetical protein
VKSVLREQGNSGSDDGNLSLAQALSVFKEKEVVYSIMKEINNMKENGVFEYTMDRQEGIEEKRFKGALPSKIFLKAKYDAQGRFVKLKARLVAGGHRQKDDSYGRTSSPTVISPTSCYACQW